MKNIRKYICYTAIIEKHTNEDMKEEKQSLNNKGVTNNNYNTRNRTINIIGQHTNE